MYKKLAVLVLIAVVLTGCIGTRVQESYTVRGQVVVYESTKPLPGVSITSTLGGVVDTTDEEGYFTLSGLKGRVTITPALDDWKFHEASITVTGPEDDLMFFAYDPSETSSGSIKISFIGDYDSIRPQMNTRDHIPFTSEIYRAEFQEPGNLVKSVTPHKFITGLADIGVAHPDYNVPLLLTSMRMGYHSSFGMPIYFDLAMSNDIIDASYLIQANRFDFEAVELTVFTKDGSYYSGGYDIPTVSEIHVDLGEDYRDVDFPHALRKYDTTHVFQFADLIPLEGVDDTILAYLVFGSYVEDKPFILNPDGAFLENINRHLWHKDGGTYLGGYVIYLPGFDIKFEDGVENHLIFSWNLDGLIEVYDNNSSDPSEHLITFRLDNPFPVEMYVEQGVAFDPPEADASVIEEIRHLDISYYELLEHEIVLRWLNPSNIEYETTHIVRKVGSAPSDVHDGDLVYAGKTPLFKDSDLEPDQHYYYRVFTQNRAGVFSKGEVADIVSKGPDLKQIEIRKDRDLVVLTVGERVQFEVSGYDSKRSHTIVVDWELG
ncbi:MAG: carboxypeptidase-like regulatory domain-containing protein, partial [Firmicutes bacterium]|nr:carboxypeptidase-like regulatory domain-containing protein [Bacillota bacterium]